MIELCLCIIKGIEKIHQIGIAHRDLKSKNVYFFFFSFFFFFHSSLFIDFVK